MAERRTRDEEPSAPLRAIPADIAETQQAVIVGRPDGVIVHVNEAFTRLTGVSADAAFGVGPDAARLRPQAAFHIGIDSLFERIRA